MQPNIPVLSLRNVLVIDAITCFLMGVLLSFGCGPIAELTAIPASLLYYAGLVLFPIALFMLIVGLRWPNNSPAVWLIIQGNVLWVGASFVLLAGVISPNTLGIAFILIQAVAVAILAWLEYRGIAVSRSALKPSSLE